MKGRNFATQINGVKVVNGKRRITIHISEKEAKEGKPKNPGDCAAAMAAVRGLPNCTKARIYRGRAYVFNSKKNLWERYKTGAPLRTEIIALDRGGTFEPGQYDLLPLKVYDFIPKKINKDDRLRKGREDPVFGDKLKKPRKLHVVRGIRHRPTLQDFV